MSSPKRDAAAWELETTSPVEGVIRIPLPLPNDALRAINVYAIPHSDGVTLIDSGWAGPATTAVALRSSLEPFGFSLDDIDRILVTHVHRDHYTFALELREKFEAEVLVGAGEAPNLEAACADPPTREGLRKRMAQAGAVELYDAYRGTASDESRWEMPDQWLRDGDIVMIGPLAIDVMATPGHTRGHVSFYLANQGTFFAGDHILPDITPSIAYEAVPPVSPLADYLASLNAVRGMPDMHLLPAHGAPGRSTHQRIDELLAHHDQRLAATCEVVGESGTAYEVAASLPWTRRSVPFTDLDPFNQMLAAGETLAHLQVLAERGLLDHHAPEDGAVVFYSRASPAAQIANR